MAHRVTLIPGDGTGPELTEATRRVLEATGVAFDWDIRHAGVDVMEQEGTPLPSETLASVKANKVALKGPITTPIGKGFRSVNVSLRQELGLYACLRPCKTFEGVRRATTRSTSSSSARTPKTSTPGRIRGGHSQADGRANQVHQRHRHRKIRPAPGTTGVSIKPMSVEGTRSGSSGSPSTTRARTIASASRAVCKANIMKFTDGLWYRTRAWPSPTVRSSKTERSPGVQPDPELAGKVKNTTAAWNTPNV